MKKWIEVNGTILRYELSGSGDEALVLIHHMGAALDSWDEVIPSVTQGRRVLRYDMRGMGLSEKVRGKVQMDTMASDLAALLDALGITGPVSFAGVALGVGIAMRFAARYPQRAQALVALSPALNMTPERQVPMLKFADEMESKGMRPLVDGMLSRSYPTELRSNTERFNTLRAQMLANDPGSFAALFRMLVDLDMQKDFAHVTCPTLVIAGTYDHLRAPSAIEAVARSLPNANFKMLETGHAQQSQTPELVAAAINGHLEDVKTGRFQKMSLQKVGA